MDRIALAQGLIEVVLLEVETLEDAEACDKISNLLIAAKLVMDPSATSSPAETAGGCMGDVLSDEEVEAYRKGGAKALFAHAIGRADEM